MIDKKYVIDRFTVIKGLKAYMNNEEDSIENPYWDAETETFNAGRMADEAIQLLEADYQVMNDMTETLQRITGIKVTDLPGWVVVDDEQ